MRFRMQRRHLDPKKRLRSIRDGESRIRDNNHDWSREVLAHSAKYSPIRIISLSCNELRQIQDYGRI